MDVKVIEIENEYESEFAKTFKEIYFDSSSEAKQHFKQHIESKTLFLLFVDSQMAGFFNYSFQYSHYANYLEDICIKKKFRGLSLSKYLLSKYIEISQHQKSKNKIALSSTHKKNIISQKMHLSFGFKEIGILKELHYGEDEIFYAYSLN